MGEKRKCSDEFYAIQNEKKKTNEEIDLCDYATFDCNGEENITDTVDVKYEPLMCSRTNSNTQNSNSFYHFSKRKGQTNSHDSDHRRGNTMEANSFASNKNTHSNGNDNESVLFDKLKSWCTDYNVSKSSAEALLQILNRHSILTKDSQFVQHSGLFESTPLITKNGPLGSCTVKSTIEMNINIDGTSGLKAESPIPSSSRFDNFHNNMMPDNIPSSDDMPNQFHPEMNVEAQIGAAAAPEHSQSSDSVNPSLLKYLKKIDRKVDNLSEVVDINIATTNSLMNNFLEEIKELKMLLRGEQHADTSLTMNTALPALPIATEEELMLTEELLQSSEEERRHLVTKLSIVGGNSDRAVVNNVMNYLLSREVALQYSLHGKSTKHNKKSFKDLTVFACALEAIRKNHQCRVTPNTEIFKYIALNLVYAKDRAEKKKKAAENDLQTLLINMSDPEKAGKSEHCLPFLQTGLEQYPRN